MASSSPSPTKVTMKLLIDTKNERVLFAEASKVVIDFLFNLLCLPIGTVVKLLSKNKLLSNNDMVGSLGNLYQSVENLNQNYMEPNQSKDVLLNPKAPSSSTQIYGFLTNNADDDEGIQPQYYTCQRYKSSNYACCGYVTCDKTICPVYKSSNYAGCGYVTCDNTTICPGRCGNIMNSELRFTGSKVDKERISIKSGFVKDIVTFMVMDDLVIQPMSTISSITLLNKFNIKEICTLQEKVVELGMEEGIKLLKASLESKLVLTSVFLEKNIDMPPNI